MTSRTVSLQLSWDRSTLAPVQDQRMHRALFRALSKSGGDAIRAARVASGRIVRFRKAFRVSRVNRGLVLAFPRQPRGDISQLEWRVNVSGSMSPVGSFASVRGFGQRIRGRKGRKEVSPGGVIAKINAGRSSRIPGAFLATMKSGHRGVFMRTGAKVKELFTSRVSDVFSDAGMPEHVLERAQQVFGRSFDRLLPLELAKLK